MRSVVQDDRSVVARTTEGKSGVATGTTRSPGAMVRRYANSTVYKTQARVEVTRIHAVAPPRRCPPGVATSPFSTRYVSTRLITLDKRCAVTNSGIGTLIVLQSHRGYPITAPTKTVAVETRFFVVGIVSENFLTVVRHR